LESGLSRSPGLFLVLDIAAASAAAITAYAAAGITNIVRASTPPEIDTSHYLALRIPSTLHVPAMANR
jgi:hypothetical protein